MSDDGNGGADRLQGQIIGEVRAYRNRMGTAHTWTMRLTSEEVDALLAAADERDALKRELVGDPDLPSWLAPKVVVRPHVAVLSEELMSEPPIDIHPADALAKLENAHRGMIDPRPGRIGWMPPRPPLPRTDIDDDTTA